MTDKIPRGDDPPARSPVQSDFAPDLMQPKLHRVSGVPRRCVAQFRIDTPPHGDEPTDTARLPTRRGLGSAVTVMRAAVAPPHDPPRASRQGGQSVVVRRGQGREANTIGWEPRLLLQPAWWRLGAELQTRE